MSEETQNAIIASCIIGVIVIGAIISMFRWK